MFIAILLDQVLFFILLSSWNWTILGVAGMLNSLAFSIMLCQYQCLIRCKFLDVV